MILFLVASGLTLIFGLMGVVNFAHGAFFMLGAYIALAVFGLFGNFWVALFFAPIIVAIIGVIVEYFGIRQLYGKDPLYQILLTFGVALVLEESVELIWGGDPISFPAPELLTGRTLFVGASYPTYRLFTILTGVLAGLGLWVLLSRTKTGLVLRAGLIDSQMVEAMGINVRRTFTIMFGIGIMLAAIGGVVIAPLLGAHPQMGHSYLIEAFVVVVLGGLGSLRGSLVGSLIVGLSLSVSGVYASTYTNFVIFLVMVVILIVRPYGLFGVPGLFEH